MKGINIKADRDRTLRFTINSIIEFKQNTGRDLIQTLTNLENDLDFEVIREVFYYGLKWEDRELTREGAGDVLDLAFEEEGLEGVIEKLAKAITDAFGIKDNKVTQFPNRMSH